MVEKKKKFSEATFEEVAEAMYPPKKSKGNKHYKVGYSLERDTKKALEQQGYTVFRMAGSHTFADLIAIEYDYGERQECGHNINFVQCKRHRNLLTQKEISDLYVKADSLGGNGVIAYRDKGIHLEWIQP